MVKFYQELTQKQLSQRAWEGALVPLQIKVTPRITPDAASARMLPAEPPTINSCPAQCFLQHSLCIPDPYSMKHTSTITLFYRLRNPGLFFSMFKTLNSCQNVICGCTMPQMFGLICNLCYFDITVVNYCLILTGSHQSTTASNTKNIYVE